MSNQELEKADKIAENAKRIFVKARMICANNERVYEKSSKTRENAWKAYSDACKVCNAIHFKIRRENR